MIKMLVCFIAITTTTIAGAEAPLTIRVSPLKSFAPANLVVRTRVEPDARNRAIEVVAESGEFFRSSVIEVEGDRAAKTRTFEFRSLPPGDYEVMVAVLGIDGKIRARARTHVNVIESGASD